MSPSGTSVSYDYDDERTQSSSKLPRLSESGENFPTWKAEVESAVIAKGLLRYMDGRAKPPIPPVDLDASQQRDATLVAAQAVQVEKYDTDYDQWMEKNAQLMTIFYRTVSPSLKLELHPLKTAAEAWKRILEEHQRNEPLSQINILTAMGDLKTEDGQDPRETLKQYAELKSRYGAAGGVMDSAQESAIILKFLPPSYRPSILPLFSEAARNKTTVTSSALLATVKAVAASEFHLENPTVVAGAFLSHAKGRGGLNSRGQAKSNRLKDKCSNCGKLGHWREDCWSKGGGKEGDGPKGKKRGGKGKEKARDETPRTKTAALAASPSPSPVPEFAFSASIPLSPPDLEFPISIDRTERAYALEKTNISDIEKKVEGTRNTHFSYILDSGASRHFEPDRSKFINYRTIKPAPIESADGRVFFATGQGDVPLVFLNGDKPLRITLRAVLHSKDMPFGLISISHMVKSKYGANFRHNGCHLLTPDGDVILTVKEQNGLYPLTKADPAIAASIAVASAAKASEKLRQLTLRELHEIMGHTYPPNLVKMVKSGAIEGVVLTMEKMGQCEVCIAANQRHEPVPSHRSTPRVESYGDRIHSDVWGPASVKSINGFQYYCTHLDEATDYNEIAFLPKKSGAFGAYKNFAARMKTQHGITIKEHQSD